MDIMQADKSEGGEHEDADAGPEIAAVYGDQELKKNRDCNPPAGRGLSFIQVRPRKPPENSLCQKQHGGKKDEERDQF